MMTECVYAPLLRWKQSEWLALKDLYPEDADRILPIIEIVPKILADRKLATVPIQLSRSWHGRKVIVDGAPLNASATSQPREVYAMLRDTVGATTADIIPVIKPNHSQDAIQAALEVAVAFNSGLAFRIGPHELGMIENLLRSSASHPANVDLVVDLGGMAAGDTRFSEAKRALPNGSLWRNVILLGGSFPKDLTGLAVGQHLLPRHEWHAWSNLGSRISDSNLMFGDYTIQHVGQAEPVPFPNFSASIRYTAIEDWVVMRGEGVRNEGGAGYDQWPANATLLRERPEYCGSGFSKGDAYIELMGTNPPSTGGPGSWLRAGINHHMTLVCRQAASLL